MALTSARTMNELRQLASGDQKAIKEAEEARVEANLASLKALEQQLNEEEASEIFACMLERDIIRRICSLSTASSSTMSSLILSQVSKLSIEVIISISLAKWLIQAQRHVYKHP